MRLISSTVREYNQETKRLAELATKIDHYEFISSEQNSKIDKSIIFEELKKLKSEFPKEIEVEINQFSQKKAAYQENKETKVVTRYISLSGSSLPIVALPNYHHKDDVVRFLRNENMPGTFPYAAGIFPLREKMKNLRGSLRVRVVHIKPISDFIF